MTWDAVEFAAHIKQTTIGTEKYENNLLRRFPPLIPLKEVVNRSTPLPVIEDPCVFVDSKERLIGWALHSVLPEGHQVRLTTILQLIC